MRADDKPFPVKRLEELAARAARTGTACFTPFLTPPETEAAAIAARRQGVSVAFSGGYEGAERKIACFCDDEPPAFPLEGLRVSWGRQPAPRHSDLLGSVTALGLRRECLGDIALSEAEARVYAESAIVSHLLSEWKQAGRTTLTVERAGDEPPTLAPREGQAVRDTVASLRLDAVLASGFGMSRTRAAELIAAGQVKLRFAPELRADARVEAGDAISARGLGRLTLVAVGTPTRKQRLPIQLLRYTAK